MIRSRFIFVIAAFIFLGLVALIHTNQKGGLNDVYQYKWDRPSFNIPDWMKSPSLDSIPGLQNSKSDYTAGYPGHIDTENPDSSGLSGSGGSASSSSSESENSNEKSSEKVNQK